MFGDLSVRLFMVGTAVAGVVTFGGTSVSWSAGIYDGTYVGSSKTIRDSNQGNCSLDKDNQRVTIVNDKFSRVWSGNTVDVTIAPDGTFRGSAQRAQSQVSRVIILAGRISNGVLEAEFGHEKCALKMVLQKQ